MALSLSKITGIGVVRVPKFAKNFAQRIALKNEEEIARFCVLSLSLSLSLSLRRLEMVASSSSRNFVGGKCQLEL